MTKSERVAYLVAGNKADSIANQVFGQIECACLRIDSTRLNYNPLADKRLYIVPLDDVGLENLTRTRVYR